MTFAMYIRITSRTYFSTTQVFKLNPTQPPANQLSSKYYHYWTACSGVCRQGDWIHDYQGTITV